MQWRGIIKKVMDETNCTRFQFDSVVPAEERGGVTIEASLEPEPGQKHASQKQSRSVCFMVVNVSIVAVRRLVVIVMIAVLVARHLVVAVRFGAVVKIALITARRLDKRPANGSGDECPLGRQHTDWAISWSNRRANNSRGKDTWKIVGSRKFDWSQCKRKWWETSITQRKKCRCFKVKSLATPSLP